MKKKILKYTCYTALSTSLLVATLLSVACSNGPEMPKMTVSYGPEEGFADGNVDLSGETPAINISDIKAEVGTNIDYLSGVIIENEEAFPDLEIWVDASLVDIFTPGDYKAVYTFVYDDKSVSEEITVTLVESEQPASEVTSVDTSTTKNNNSNTHIAETETTSGNKDNNTATTSNTVNNQTENNQTTNIQTDTEPTTTQTTSQSATTNPNNQSTTTNPNNQSAVTPTTSSTKPPQTTTAPTATKPVQTTTKPTTTRQIITTAGNATTESKNIGNYTIELLSGKSITIKNTTAKYIVSTRTDVTTLEEKGKTYRISKLIITYNTGFEQILETVKERIK